MAAIRVEIEIAAPAEDVWRVVSDIDNEPRFWRGTTAVRNISTEGGVVTREITIAFRDQKCLQRVTLCPGEAVEAEFTGGIIRGTKRVLLERRGESTLLATEWDIRLAGAMGIFTGMLKKHIRSGTEQAMRAIKQEIEG